MAENFELKKINVRSPYYVNVVNRSDETQDDIDPTPTEPLSNTFTHECGDTVSIGSTADRNIYNINLSNRGTGTFTINFSNLKVPIRYRFGMAGSLPAFQTSKGLNIYEPQWLAETGETVNLSDFVTNPNGVSQAITYDVTQSDLDSGNNLVLEIFHPIISAGYSFSSVCQDLQAADDVDTSSLDVPSVFVVTVVRRSQGSGYTTPFFGTRPLGVVDKRIVFSDASLNITPTHTGTSFFKDSSLPTSTWDDLTVQYVGTPRFSALDSNTLDGAVFSGRWTGSGFNDWDIDYIISRHPVYQDAQNNWKFKTWADAAEPIQATKLTINMASMCAEADRPEIRNTVNIIGTDATAITKVEYVGNSALICNNTVGQQLLSYQLYGLNTIIQDA